MSAKPPSDAVCKTPTSIHPQIVKEERRAAARVYIPLDILEIHVTLKSLRSKDIASNHFAQGALVGGGIESSGRFAGSAF